MPTQPLGANSDPELNLNFTESSTLHTSPGPPREALPQRSKRPAEVQASSLFPLAAVCFVTAYASPFIVSGWWALGCVCVGLLAALGITFIAEEKRIKATKSMKCRGCWKTEVRTPFCPWCGEKDPLGDYDEWVKEVEMQNEIPSKASKKGFWQRFGMLGRGQ